MKKKPAQGRTLMDVLGKENERLSKELPADKPAMEGQGTQGPWPFKPYPEPGQGLPIDQVNLDPWVHRSKGMRCATCMAWVEKSTSRHPDRLRGPIGRCRRHAPTMQGYPVVFATDWCLDHKLDEEKL